MLREENYSFRDIKEEDLDLILDWRNQDYIRANMYSDHIITREEHRKWYASIKENPTVIYKIFMYRDQPIGVIYFTDIDFKNNKCVWGFYLGDNSAPRGSGGIMLYFGLKFIFEEQNIRKITGEVFSFNGSSIKLHTKLGFEEEGILKNHVRRGNNYQDIVIMAQFKEKWIERREEFRNLVFPKEK